jgi:hypothetical protein
LCSIRTACWSMLLTATKRIVGRVSCAASAPLIGRVLDLHPVHARARLVTAGRILLAWVWGKSDAEVERTIAHLHHGPDEIGLSVMWQRSAGPRHPSNEKPGGGTSALSRLLESPPVATSGLEDHGVEEARGHPRSLSRTLAAQLSSVNSKLALTLRGKPNLAALAGHAAP